MLLVNNLYDFNMINMLIKPKGIDKSLNILNEKTKVNGTTIYQ